MIHCICIDSRCYKGATAAAMATVEELPEEVLEQILRQPGLSCRDLVAAGLTVLYCTVLYCTVQV